MGTDWSGAHEDHSACHRGRRDGVRWPIIEEIVPPRLPTASSHPRAEDASTLSLVLPDGTVSTDGT